MRYLLRGICDTTLREWHFSSRIKLSKIERNLSDHSDTGAALLKQIRTETEKIGR
jgi:hypothetical protein